MYKYKLIYQYSHCMRDWGPCSSTVWTAKKTCFVLCDLVDVYILYCWL